VHSFSWINGVPPEQTTLRDVDTWEMCNASLFARVQSCPRNSAAVFYPAFLFIAVPVSLAAVILLLAELMVGVVLINSSTPNKNFQHFQSLLNSPAISPFASGNAYVYLYGISGPHDQSPEEYGRTKLLSKLKNQEDQFLKKYKERSIPDNSKLLDNLDATDAQDSECGHFLKKFNRKSLLLCRQTKPKSTDMRFTDHAPLVTADG